MMNWNLRTMGKVVLALTALTLLSNIALVERGGQGTGDIALWLLVAYLYFRLHKDLQKDRRRKDA